MIQRYWEEHPTAYEIVQIIREGQWVTHVFEWIFMMVSRFAGYLMTLAVGYLIYYAIEFKHSLDAIPAHPQFSDALASFSNVVINVGPELVFPGVVVLCIRAFTVRRWLDAVLYLVTTIAFVILTMVLLNAFMSGQITKVFLESMLFWRAGAALSYTVVVAYCGGHGGLDFRSLLNELDTLRGQLDGGQQTVSSLQEELSTVQQRVSSLQQQVNSGQREVSSLQEEVDSGQGDSTLLRRKLNAALVEAETLQTQLNGKQQELELLRGSLESGQEWQESRMHQLLGAEQERVSALQKQVTDEQEAVTDLRRQLSRVAVDADGLRTQLSAKQQELERVQAALDTERQSMSTIQNELSTGESAVVALRRQLNTALGDIDGLRLQLDTKQREIESLRATGQQTVSSLQEELDRTQQEVSNLRHKLDSGQGVKVSTVQVSNGQGKVDTGQGKVVRLDTNRSRKSGQDESLIAEQIKQLLLAEPDLSGRAIAGKLGCSPTTASRWKQFFENDGQSPTECVNG